MKILNNIGRFIAPIDSESIVIMETVDEYKTPEELMEQVILLRGSRPNKVLVPYGVDLDKSRLFKMLIGSGHITEGVQMAAQVIWYNDI